MLALRSSCRTLFRGCEWRLRAGQRALATDAAGPAVPETVVIPAVPPPVVRGNMYRRPHDGSPRPERQERRTRQAKRHEFEADLKKRAAEELPILNRRCRHPVHARRAL